MAAFPWVAFRRPLHPAAAAGLAALGLSLAACQDGGSVGGVSARSIAPIPAPTLALMQSKSMSPADPILIRAYKKEAEMEVWKRTGTGQYALLKTFPICRWSGQLGPKTKQGDRQAPEGFYTITPGQMNPNSSYYLSFDVGYPNAVDRAKGGTGNYIMVHGTCSSAGCFAMTDASMGEVYAITREAFAGGQRAVQFQSYPFRMNAANVARFRNDPNAPFWKNLKEGSDYFEALHDEPRVAACGTRYVFGGADVAAGSCTPRVDPLVAEKRMHDERAVADLVAKGEKATRVVYEDGGQNPVFRPQAPTGAFASLTEADKDKDAPYSAKEYGRHHLGDVSRPESLAAGPQEIEIDAKGRPVLVAAADAPGPTKAAAAALARKTGKGGSDRGGSDKMAPGTTLLAAKPDAKSETKSDAPAGEKPARIAVADAEGDGAAYQKLLGNLFGKPAAAPEAAPAADAKTDAKIDTGTEAKAGRAAGETPSARIAARHAARARVGDRVTGEAAGKDARRPAAEPADKKAAVRKTAVKQHAAAEPAPAAKGEAPRGRN